MTGPRTPTRDDHVAAAALGDRVASYAQTQSPDLTEVELLLNEIRVLRGAVAFSDVHPIHDHALNAKALLRKLYGALEASRGHTT